MRKRGVIGVAIVLLFATIGFIAPSARALDIGQLLGYGKNNPTLDTFKLIHVADLRAMIGCPGVYVYDANADGTRDKYGIIPGATLLDSDDKYPLSVLPRDKHAKLVFYCANWL